MNKDIRAAMLGDHEAAKLLKRLIEIFTDPGDVVIGPMRRERDNTQGGAGIRAQQLWIRGVQVILSGCG